MGESMVSSSRSLPFLLTRALLRNDIPDATGSEVQAAAAKVQASIDSMPDFTRFGVRVTSMALDAALTAYCREPFGHLSPKRQEAIANRLADTSLPVLTEFVRLTRSLGIVSVYEARTPQLRTETADGLHG
jgi:hypothetical protein